MIIEKKIFDDWFEEKADEYFPWIRDQGLDDETIRANPCLPFSSPPYNPEMCEDLAHVSPTIFKDLQRPKQDRKTLEEEARKETERLANITRYERSLKETRKAIDKIKKEKQRKLLFPQTQHQKLSCVILPECSIYSASNECSFQKKLCKEQMTAGVDNNVSNTKVLEMKLKSGSVLSKRRIRWNNEERTEQIALSKLKQQISEHHSDDDSDNELLRLALESSPIQKSDPVPRITPNNDELSDEALLAMMTSSPVSSPKIQKEQMAN
ncbi:unnamed protein product [Wuchereria bancrofti]|uniref:Uncharacterized protein n=1 Tax=Wuchereria bancrofti TaxID=6293 RepID=A0A3P7DZR7_WUCBA|nr:unnamed protein product [Wuchereria bancrofti]